MHEAVGAGSDGSRRGWRSLGVGVGLVVVAAGVVLVAATSGDRASLVEVGSGAKEVTQPYELLGPEAFVRPAEPGGTSAGELRSAMDRSPAVERYLYLPYGLGSWLTSGEGSGDISTQLVLGQTARECPTMLSPAFVVDLDFDLPDPAAAFDAAVRPAERVTGPFLFSDPVVDRRVDVEIFMEVDATPEEVAAVRARLDADVRFVTVTHLTKQDAYDEFRRVFRDEPELLGNVSPESLPESFRLTVVDRRSRHDALAEELERGEGVDEVIVSRWLGRRLDPGPPLDTPVDDAVDRSLVEVFVRIEATSGERDAVRAALEDDPRVASVSHVTHQDAYDEFVSAFRDQPDLVENVSPGMLPESFRVSLVDPDDAEALRDDLTELRGVEEVVIPFGNDEEFTFDVCPPPPR
jgi:cell division protein FtsX